MRIKKLVSAFSALAITVTAIAGLAVTASAAEEIVLNNNCSTAEGWKAGGGGSVEVSTEGEESYIDCYGAGSGNRVANYTFPENVRAITTGTATLTFDFYFNNNNGAGNKDGVEAVVSIDDIWSVSGYWNDVNRNDTYYPSNDADYSITIDTQTWYTIKADLNLDAKTANVTLAKRDGGTVVYTASNVSFTEGGLTTLTIQSPRYDGGTRHTYIDNITVKTVTELATDIDVVYKSGDTAIKTISKQLSGMSSGDSYTYAYPAYVQDDAGNWYKSVETTYVKSVSLVVGKTTVDVAYTPVDHKMYFAEGETFSDVGITTGLVNLSNGSSSRAVDAGVDVCTVDEAAAYKITVVATCRNYDSSSEYTVYKNSVNEANIIGSGDAIYRTQNNPYVGVQENVILNAGDKVILTGDRGNTNIDYILVEKTGEYIPPAAEATEVAVKDAEGVIALKVDNVALTSTSRPVWNITATDGQEYDETIKVNATAQLPTVDSTASLGLIVDNIPDGIDVTATLSY